MASLQEKQDYIQCAKQGISSLKGLSDDQVLQRAQQDVGQVAQLAIKRSTAAKAQGLGCYETFNNNYGQALATLVFKTLSAAPNGPEKSLSARQIASVTEINKCDEAYRAIHINDTVECNIFERFGGALVEYSMRLSTIDKVYGPLGDIRRTAPPTMNSVATQVGDIYCKILILFVTN